MMLCANRGEVGPCTGVTSIVVCFTGAEPVSRYDLPTPHRSGRRHHQTGTPTVMQTMKIAGLAAALALATALSAPAFAQTRADTFGGGNRNTASGRFSDAQQSVTTIGGQAIGGSGFGQGRRGGFGGGAVANTFGGHNTNTASGKFSSAVQDVTTIGGVAQAGRGGRGFGGGAVANTFGGGNRNTASGFGSSASGACQRSCRASFVTRFPILVWAAGRRHRRRVRLPRCSRRRRVGAHRPRHARFAARGCGRLRAFHHRHCAPWRRERQVGTGKQARRSNRKAGAGWRPRRRGRARG